jgi:hypothetical protein
MNTQDQTVEDMVKSLTYFDEMAIEQAFGVDWSNLAQNKPVTLLRALCFVQLRREGKNDHEAKQAAFEMSLDTVQNTWVEEDEEVFVDEPTTESGKDVNASS